MAIHYIQSSESRQAMCGRNNPNSATVGGWGGVTCKNCLKLKPKDGSTPLTINSSTISPQDKLREKITRRFVQYNYDGIDIGKRMNETGDFVEANKADADFVSDILAAVEAALPELAKEAGYVKVITYITLAGGK